jgi:ABC-type branched-subunit amino acid transport system substrate-binding protein
VRRAALLTLAAAAVLAGCGGDDDPRDSTRVKGDTLTVYASLPAHGESADAGRAAELGVRRAVQDASGRIGGRRIELVVLPSTRPGDRSWDPGTIEANAERAADDPTAIAYVGELDQGGSAVSLPVTNGAGLLQVSPADGLTSLTRRPPGRPKAGPERYYPERPRNFVRLVPPDLEVARQVVETLRERPARRLAVLHGDRIADRELESMILWMARKGLPEVVARAAVREVDPEDRARQAAELVEDLVAERPDATLYAGAATREAEPVLQALGERLGGVPVVAGPQLVAPRGFEQAPTESCAFTATKLPTPVSQRANPLLRTVRADGLDGYEPHALLAYDATQLALGAIEDGGPDRRRVISAARRAGSRSGLFGSFSVDGRGDAVGRPVECVDLATGR